MKRGLESFAPNGMGDGLCDNIEPGKPPSKGMQPPSGALKFRQPWKRCRAACG